MLNEKNYIFAPNINSKQIKKMKNLIIAAVAVLSIGVVSAQETKFGAKAGLNIGIASASGGNTTVSSSENGFYVGGFAQIGVSEKFAIQPELLYAKVKELGQIQIPILAKYNFTKEFSALAGPELGFLTGDQLEGSKKFNYGLDLGAAYDITENFIIDARYNFGLANLLKDAPSGVKSTLSNFQVGVAYRF